LHIGYSGGYAAELDKAQGGSINWLPGIVSPALIAANALISLEYQYLGAVKQSVFNNLQNSSLSLWNFNRALLSGLSLSCRVKAP
jgi:hypothetical protein